MEDPQKVLLRRLIKAAKAMRRTQTDAEQTAEIRKDAVWKQKEAFTRMMESEWPIEKAKSA